jgi:hypothetical protein
LAFGGAGSAGEVTVFEEGTAMQDDLEQEQAGLGAAPQGASDEGRPDVDDPDADDTLGGGQHQTSGAGGAEDDPLTAGSEADPDAGQPDPESGPAADQPERPDQS